MHFGSDAAVRLLGGGGGGGDEGEAFTFIGLRYYLFIFLRYLKFLGTSLLVTFYKGI